MKILISGVAGQLAHLVAMRLAPHHELVGVDVRPLPRGRPFPGQFVWLKRYNSRPATDVFRTHRPDVFISLGQVPTTSNRSTTQRYTQNVLGTKHMLDACVKYSVRRVVVMSTYHVYGAYSANPIHLDEDAPLRASQIFPQLADVVELDHAATNFMWRHRQVETVVLRFANLAGPDLNNLISRTLRRSRVPKLWGYDPMMQFIHQDDAAEAFATVAEGAGFGVYNVSGEGGVAWSHAIRHAGGRQVLVPHMLAYSAFRLISPSGALPPEHLLDYFRYPTVIDDSRFREETSWSPALSTVETLRSVNQERT